MHKRRRKRLITRSLTQDHALLDDIHHGQVQCVLDRVNQWPFNAFILDNVTGGRSLPVLCVHLFHWYGLLDHFKLDVVRCWKFFSLIEEGYHSTNPYHNSVHATDVTQAMHCFLQEKKIREHLTPLEIMASLIAAVTHDLDHPGVNQPFLVATSNHLAALYENSSVLENHHWRSAIGCLLESHVTEEIEDCRLELQSQISSLILATDITRQQEFLVRFKSYLDQGLLDMELKEHRHFVLQIALKCADISNPCRPWEVSKKWSQKVCEEFFRQGDYERQLNLPVTALCDRQSTSVPKIQAGFFTFVVYPLFEEWHRFLGDGLSDDMMKNLHGNKLKWDALIRQEDEEGSKNDTLVEEEEGIERKFSEDASEGISAPALELGRKALCFDVEPGSLAERRHSVPLGGSGQPRALSQSVRRRESAAVADEHSRILFEEMLQKNWTESRRDSSSSNGSESEKKSGRGNKPPSSETLMPELSITSMTTPTEASRLSCVLSKERNSRKAVAKVKLTRQQTFPPVLPYVRQRYLSGTIETCRRVDVEAAAAGVSAKKDDGEQLREETVLASSAESRCGTKRGCPGSCLSKAAVLKENNKWYPKATDGDRCGKRESEGLGCEKAFKLSRSSESNTNESCGKENVDPRKFGSDLDLNGFFCNKSGGTVKNPSQGHISRRRGSAPVSSDAIGPAALALRVYGDRFSRRGSVPADAMRCSADEEKNVRMQQDASLCSSQQHCPYQRRGSVPSDSAKPETKTELTASGGRLRC